MKSILKSSMTAKNFFETIDFSLEHFNVKQRVL